jgi:hypothetical protein
MRTAIGFGVSQGLGLFKKSFAWNLFLKREANPVCERSEVTRITQLGLMGMDTVRLILFLSLLNICVQVFRWTMSWVFWVWS